MLLVTCAIFTTAIHADGQWVLARVAFFEIGSTANAPYCISIRIKD